MLPKSANVVVIGGGVLGTSAAFHLEAFPDDTAPLYLLRGRDGIYGTDFRERVASMGIKELLTAPRSPWQNPFAERLIGSAGRECWTMSLCSTADTCSLD